MTSIAPVSYLRPRRLGYLAVAAAALSAAVVLAPFPLAAAFPGGGYHDIAALRESVSSGFVRSWSTGAARLDGELVRAADFWARFHVVKAALAGLLLVVLAVLVVRVWLRFARATTLGKRLGLALAGSAATPLTVLALLVLVANLQGAIAPLPSLIGVLPLGAPHGELAGTVTSVRHSLATEAQTPSANVLVHDFTVYHVAMAALGTVTTLALLVAAGLVARHRARVPHDDRGWRRVLVLGVLTLISLAGFFGIVTAANIGTAVDPVPALIGFFAGGA